MARPPRIEVHDEIASLARTAAQQCRWRPSEVYAFLHGRLSTGTEPETAVRALRVIMDLRVPGETFAEAATRLGDCALMALQRRHGDVADA